MAKLAHEIIEDVLGELGIKAPTLAKNTGLKYQRISDIQRKVTKGISGEVANAIKTRYPQFNITWLLTGEGDMFVDMPDKEQIDNIVDGVLDSFGIARSLPNAYLHIPKIEANHYQMIDTEEKYIKAMNSGLKMLPEIDFEFSAGQRELLYGNGKNVRYWYLPDCEDCEVVASMAGTSMMPTYPPGCKLVLKRYGFNISRPNEIAFGNTYAVVIEDPFTGLWHGHIKILRRYKDAEMAKKYWIARSINQSEYDDFDIDLGYVRGLWVVKQYVVNNILL